MTFKLDVFTLSLNQEAQATREQMTPDLFLGATLSKSHIGVTICGKELFKWMSSDVIRYNKWHILRLDDKLNKITPML